MDGLESGLLYVVLSGRIKAQGRLKKGRIVGRLGKPVYLGLRLKTMGRLFRSAVISA